MYIRFILVANKKVYQNIIFYNILNFLDIFCIHFTSNKIHANIWHIAVANDMHHFGMHLMHPAEPLFESFTWIPKPIIGDRLYKTCLLTHKQPAEELNCMYIQNRSAQHSICRSPMRHIWSTINEELRITI